MKREGCSITHGYDIEVLNVFPYSNITFGYPAVIERWFI